MRRALLASCVVASVIIACGSRGPLDDEPGGTTADAGDASSLGADAAVLPPLVDGGHDAGPLACAGCVLQTCGDAIVSCIGTPECVGVFTCLTSTCLGLGTGDGGGGSGGVNPTCLLGCAAKNPAGALQVLQIFQCVTGTCGTDCGALLGGLGGLSGLGGLGGLGGSGGLGGGGGQKIDAIDRDAFEQVFSPWPELTSR